MAIDTRGIPGGTDLRRFFVATMLEWIDAGWQLGEFRSVDPTSFCIRGSERRMVTIQPVAPGALTSDTSGLQSCAE
jgi:hypothetical protein